MTEQEETTEIYTPDFHICVFRLSPVCALFSPRFPLLSAPFLFPLRALEHPDLSRREKKRSSGCGNHGKSKATQGKRVSPLVHGGAVGKWHIGEPTLFIAKFVRNF